MKACKVGLAFILFISMASNAFAQHCASTIAMHWILGDWVANNGKTLITESWILISDKTFEGYGETKRIDSGVSIASESLRLVEMSNELFYIAKPQQNNLPVAFKMTECSERRAIFENPEHDFPRKIEYELRTENILKATVTGENEKGFSINFHRQ